MLQVQKLIHQAGYFVDIDTSDRTMQKKVRVAQLAQYNYILVVGEEEASSGKQKLVPGISCTIPSHLVVECYKLLKFSRQHPLPSSSHRSKRHCVEDDVHNLQKTIEDMRLELQNERAKRLRIEGERERTSNVRAKDLGKSKQGLHNSKRKIERTFMHK